MPHGVTRAAAALAAFLALVTIVAASTGADTVAAAPACVCADEPVEDRLERVDAAVIGEARAVTDPDWAGPTQARLMLFQITQRVKGDVRGRRVGSDDRVIFVQTPLGTDCDVPDPPRRETTGLLLTTTTEGRWYATACSFVDPGELVAAGGEPRGGPIKVAIGAVVLGLVLLLAFVRLRRGSRPQLPGGAPR